MLRHPGTRSAGNKLTGWRAKPSYLIGRSLELPPYAYEDKEEDEQLRPVPVGRSDVGLVERVGQRKSYRENRDRKRRAQVMPDREPVALDHDRQQQPPG